MHIINYICFQAMFFGNHQLLQRHLHNDLNTFIKNIKAREDQHLTLLQYNKGVIAQIGQMDSIPFLQEQIAKHKTFYSSMQSSHQKLQEEEKQLIEKYACTISGEPSTIKLLSRATARAFQIFQASLDKAKFLDDTLFSKHQEIKTTLLRIINQDKIEVQNLLQLIISYIQQKNSEQIKKLNEIIKILIEGDLDKLNTVYKPPQPKVEAPKIISPEKKENKKSLDKQKEKERIQKIKQQTKNAQKIKKQKTKLAAKMVTSLYSTMEISKQQLNDDMIFRHPQEQRKKLYEEIMSRNKLNHQQILSFQAKKDQFQKKVKEFKQMMEKQSQKIQQALVFIRPPIKNPQIEAPTPTLHQNTKSQTDQICEIVLPQKQKMFRKRQKKQIKAPSPRIFKQPANSSMQSTQEGFQHIKFDANNQQVFPRTNRAKLPQISGRSSLDNRYDKKKGKSEAKQDKRVNIAKNVDIGSFSSVAVKNSSLAYQNNRKSPRDKSPGPAMYEVNMNGGLNQMIGGFDFTFYARKKGGYNKFNETKNNFII